MRANQLSAAETDRIEPIVPIAKSGTSSAESRYLQGDVAPVTSSVLISNSKYLNNPYYRDAWCQHALRRHGHDLPPTYGIPMLARALGEVTDYAEYMRLLEVEKKKNPEFADWLAARRYTSWERGALTGCVPGTLGHALWEFLGIEGVQAELQMKGVEVTNDIDYYAKRRGSTHDLEHILSGFGPNAAGEQALAFVTVGSTSTYFSPELVPYISGGLSFIAAAGVQRVSLHYSKALPQYLESSQLGIQMGLALKKPFVMQPWEDFLDWQLDDIAAHLGIVRGPGKAWDWTTAATTG